MKRLSKTLAGIVCLCLLTSSLYGCEKQQIQPTETETSVFASFYPLYAAAQLIAADVPGVNLNCLVQPQDGCIRSYQLSDWDLALLQTADLVIAGGRGLENFENLLYAMGENGPAVVSVLYNMELTQRHAANTQEDTQSHWMDPNPHIYMRTAAMAEIVNRIAESLILLDPVNESIYRANQEEASEKLARLADEIQTITSGLDRRKVIVMNEALVYAAQEYGLDIALCYERESGEDLRDADFDACIQALDKADAKVILIEKQAPKNLCNALLEAGYQLACMDVLSTRRTNEGSEAYFEALQENAHAVKNAFEEAAALPEANNAGGTE